MRFSPNTRNTLPLIAATVLAFTLAACNAPAPEEQDQALDQAKQAAAAVPGAAAAIEAQLQASIAAIVATSPAEPPAPLGSLALKVITQAGAGTSPGAAASSDSGA